MVRTDVDDGLLAQHKLMVAVNLSKWGTCLDHKVATIVIEGYMRAHKNARVSLRQLERETGATRANVIASIRHICSHGVFTVLREGKGTRPTEYLLNFDYPVKSASGIVHDTSTRGIVHDTSSGIVHNTSSSSSGIVRDTESYLHIRPTGRHTESRNHDVDGTRAPASGDETAGADAPLLALHRACGPQRKKEGRSKSYGGYGVPNARSTRLGRRMPS